MHLISDNPKNISISKIESLVVQENAFIKKLFAVTCMPSRNEDEKEEKYESMQKKQSANDKTRAKSLTELQERLNLMKGKNNISYKDKMLKKGIKNKLKKKTKSNERKMQKKLVDIGKVKTEEVKQEVNEKVAKPVFNSEGKMVFSKFDFSDIGNKEKKKGTTDPKKLLKKLEKQQEKIVNLKESGDFERATEVQEKTVWKNALAKASGEKVRDDPSLLKKSIKKREQKHKSSKKKWDARQEAVEKGKEERQKKRQENIDKRKKTKKINKLKAAAKKGKVIPGF
ncbi:surfeit locus protein 6 homolog [Coccinella septempunctata]|uniref:surfeit locus protein 6 homolog n=1 Tax=Coccinella septempunctata TaxID=41139 RepID=UPI001D074DAC|nr:surfeit locus protein 6 homolog [Coccinella septempunctata]